MNNEKPLNCKVKLKKASDWLSPMSTLLVAIATNLPVVVLLRPTFTEMLTLGLMDSLLLLLFIRPLEGRFFLFLYPSSTPYFDEINHKQISALSLEARISLIRSMMEFPKKRARYVYIGTTLKNIPLIGLCVFYWKHDTSNFIQFSICVGINLIAETYFYGAIYLELHSRLSAILESFNEQHNFSNAFSQMKVTYQKKELEIHDGLILLFIMAFMLSLQCTILLSHRQNNPSELVWKLSLVSFIGSTLFGHIWHLERRYFINGLEKVFNRMSMIDYRHSLNCLPLDTSPLLANFEKTFNLLIERLKSSETELASWVFQEAERSRYRAIGEMSGLIAHDLIGPLHVAQFCLTEMRDSNIEPKELHYLKYMNHLNQNLNRAVELTTSLKARLKNPDSSFDSTNYLDAHQHVLTLLETQFPAQDFLKINFHIDHSTLDLTLKLCRVELIQVLDNIFRNSVSNLLLNRIQNPFIRISSAPINNNRVEVHIQDNGTGLSKARFEKLTAYGFTQTDSADFGKSLGLRLTKRLIEYRQGSLDLVEGKIGTTFKLILPFVQDKVIIAKPKIMEMQIEI